MRRLAVSGCLRTKSSEKSLQTVLPVWRAESKIRWRRSLRGEDIVQKILNILNEKRSNIWAIDSLFAKGWQRDLACSEARTAEKIVGLATLLSAGVTASMISSLGAGSNRLLFYVASIQGALQGGEGIRRCARTYTNLELHPTG